VICPVLLSECSWHFLQLSNLIIYQIDNRSHCEHILSRCACCQLLVRPQDCCRITGTLAEHVKKSASLVLLSRTGIGPASSRRVPSAAACNRLNQIRVQLHQACNATLLVNSRSRKTTDRVIADSPTAMCVPPSILTASVEFFCVDWLLMFSSWT
jgi:hypothetical protein